jgi:hypothetical protein
MFAIIHFMEVAIMGKIECTEEDLMTAASVFKEYTIVEGLVERELFHEELFETLMEYEMDKLTELQRNIVNTMIEGSRDLDKRISNQVTNEFLSWIAESHKK